MTMEDLAKGLTDSQIIKSNIITLNTRITNLEADVKTHDKLLLTGNGEPSLMERMRNEENFTKGMRYWLRFIGGALILQILAFLFATVMAIVRFLPILERLAAKP